MKAPTAIIAEDEPALLDWLKRTLAATWPELAIVGEAAGGNAAIELIARHRPEIAFLDIRMPGRNGLEVAATCAGNCHVVFVTAYEEFAVAAFEAEAVDYLLKPVDEERLRLTVQRLKARLDKPPMDLSALLAKLGAPERNYLEWIQASFGGAIEFIPVERVDAFVAADKATLCLTVGKEYVLRTSLKDLEAQLDPKRFWRIHRNAIIRVAAIEKAQRDGFGLAVRLRGHAKSLPVSRASAERFRGM